MYEHLEEHDMAARSVWKGAINFGLVHVPVALYLASQSNDIDFDWLDARTMDPVGYKRVNKRTGKEITKEHIVKGVKQPDGDYVIVSDEEVEAAYPRTVQAIEIEAFVQAQEVSFVYLERPYYLESINKGDKVYALLRDAMNKAGVIGIARVVLHTKEHLAALVPAGSALMLDLLRWADDIRTTDGLHLPDDSIKPKEAELKMATELVRQMTSKWKPDAYKDTFADAIRQLIEVKVKAGKTERVTPLEALPQGGGGNVIDLAELLRSSLRQRKGGEADEAETAAHKTGKATKAPAKPTTKTATKAARKRA
jgi:DNA end-binding protein Ku